MSMDALTMSTAAFGLCDRLGAVTWNESIGMPVEGERIG